MNNDPKICAAMQAQLAPRFEGTGKTLRVVCDDLYAALLQLNAGGVSGVWVDENKGSRKLEQTDLLRAVRHACAPNAYVAITASSRGGDAQRLADMLVDVARREGPTVSYNRNGPMSFSSFRVRPVTPRTRSVITKRLRENVDDAFESSVEANTLAMHLIDGTFQPSAAKMRKTMKDPGCRPLIEVNPRGKWIFLLGTEPCIGSPVYRIKYWGEDEDRVHSIPIDHKSIVRLATHVPAELFPN